MPTDKDSLNPAGLMKAALGVRDARTGAEAAADGLLSLLADSEGFAAQFDEAVARADKDQVLKLIAEAGAPEDVEVTIDGLDADRSIEIKYCTGPFNWYCVGVKIVW